MNFRVFIVVASLLLSLSGKADFFCRKRDFASDKGFMQSHISNVQQDKSGFMWFATWNGLIRFDGYNFYTFRPILCSDGTIYSNRIYNIKTSSTGNLWCVSSDNRLFSFNPSTCKFVDIQRLIPVVNDKKVKVLTPLGNGATWVTFKDGSCLRLCDATPEENFVYLSSGCDSLMGCRKIWGISFDEGGNEWILTDRGAINWSRNWQVAGNYRYVCHIAGSSVLISPDGMVARLNETGDISQYEALVKENVEVAYVLRGDNQLFVATDKGVWSINAFSGALLRYSSLPAIYLFEDSRRRIWAFGKDHAVTLIPDVGVRSSVLLATTRAEANAPIKNPQLIMEDSYRNIILKPAGGVLSYYDEAAGELRDCLFYSGNQAEIYAPTDIKKFLVDYDKNLWVFHPDGAECISFCLNFFTHWENGHRQETRAIMADALGRRWIADRTNVVTIMDGENRVIGRVSDDGRLSQSRAPLSRMPIYCIKEAPDHSVWIGTKGDGVYLLQPEDSLRNNFRVTHFKRSADDQKSLRSDSIYDIAFSGERVLLASYGNGFSVGSLSASGWQFDKVGNQPDGMKIRNILDAGSGVWLLGTADGLAVADLRDFSSPEFYFNKYHPAEWGLKGNDIMSIVRCNGRYYACVYGSGVSRIDSENLLSDSLRFTNYLIPSTETADQIKTAVAQDRCIWIVSEQSLTRFSAETGQYSTYTHNHFIGRFSFSEAAPAIENGRITIGTSDGILSFSGGDMVEPDNDRRIVVTGIRYQNDISMHPLNDVNELDICSDKRSFSLYVSALEYGERKSIRFRYRMDGYESGWNYISDYQAAITYNNLAPGDYRLVIETVDDKGDWHKNSRAVQVRVEPLFIETFWFRLMLGSIIVVALLGMFYAIIYFKRMRNVIQKKYSLLMTVDRLSKDFAVNNASKQELGEDEKDKLFIEESVAFFHENIGNSALVVEDFARHLGMSRTAYYNKMKQLTGLSPIDFIKQMRIKQALKLLDEGCLSITEIAYRVGFADPKYFSRCFKAEMDMTPTQYIGSRKTGEKSTG